MIVVSKQSPPLSAFLLTRQWKESSTGLELIFWFASSKGPLRLHLPRQEVVCFFPSRQTGEVKKILKGQKTWRINPTELLDFTRQEVSALYFSSQRQLFDNRDRLAIRDIRLLEADIKPDEKIKDLSIAQRHIVQISRSLVHDADIVIMDEPTASLSQKEIEELYSIIRNLKKQKITK